jgi:hypothetical protein
MADMRILFAEGLNIDNTPDFYLIESDTYVEVKGYKTEKDEAKWNQFPKHRKLKILMKEDLISLGVDINSSVAD